MKIDNPTVAVILDTRRQKADNTFPLKLRLTFQRIRKYYSIGIDLIPSVWEDVQDKAKTRRELREIRERISDFEKRAEKVIKPMDAFSFSSFEDLYFRSEKEDSREAALRSDVAHAFAKNMAKLAGEGRAATAESYGNAISSLMAYKKKLKFEDLTPDFLKGYEKTMLAAGRSSTTIGIYLRALRAIINLAIDDEVMTRKQYPFGKNRYQIPGGRNLKKALTLAEVEKIFHYPAESGSQEDKARDFWIFSYLCNGVNLKDVSRLKWRNISKGSITFIRAKTELTNKSNLKPIVAVLTDPAAEVIQKWGNVDRHPDAFVFSVLNEGVTPKLERSLIQYFTRFVNRWMLKIAKNLGIDKPVTSYYARHSFATVLKRSGAPIEYISESLGHSDMKTTDNYLDGFEDDVKREYTKALLNFSKNSDK